MSKILRALNESSLADQVMQAAKQAGLNPRLRGTPEQERERTKQMLAQREKDRAMAPKPTYSPEQIEQLKQQLEKAKQGFDPNYEYSDDHSYWTTQKNKAQTINSIERQLQNAGVNLKEDITPATYKQIKSLLSEVDNRSKQQIIKTLTKDLLLTESGNRMSVSEILNELALENKHSKEVDYDDPEWDAMVSRVGQLAKQGERKTVYDPDKRVYKTVPVNPPKKEQGVAEGKMAELEMDLEDPEITDRQFEKMYGMTRKEAREQFSQTDMWAFPEIRDPNRPLHERGVAEDQETDNFTIDDIKKLEQINDFSTLKARAKELIKGKPIRRMKPEKIAYFYDRIDTLSSPMKVIKLMYDLLLAGEGFKTIGSRNSMDPNVYQKRFTEEQLDELKCWPGYTRVQGVPAGAPGSCKKKTSEGASEHKCPHCGGEMVSEELMNEKKDACYYKVKSRYKVWPSAYASGALVKCRKKGASNWGTKSESSILEGLEQVDENLHKWLKEKWVRFGPDGKIRGACARGDDSEGKPKCLPQAKAHSLGKKGRKYAAAKKRREDPNPERRGPAKNVATKKKSNEGLEEQHLNELFDEQQEYFKLADGQVIRVDYKQAGLSADGMPGSIKIVPVDPKIMPMSGMQAIQPWDKARQNIKMAIQKWVQSSKQGVAEGTEFGSYYHEQLAQKVFDIAPNLDNENDILKTGYMIAKKELGSRAQGIFRDEDFPSDFVSAYIYLRKN